MSLISDKTPRKNSWIIHKCKRITRKVMRYHSDGAICSAPNITKDICATHQSDRFRLVHDTMTLLAFFCLHSAEKALEVPTNSYQQYIVSLSIFANMAEVFGIVSGVLSLLPLCRGESKSRCCPPLFNPTPPSNPATDRVTFDKMDLK
jgi:hypothetical protein